ncbi:GPALPP motifs-containing protein 1 [Homalodisca vitripennis]|nr:GPALPP motifs-containing protein 1 [Homalodisca vitripennis]
MGPRRRTDNSSESDEESSIRHDKFKSERFQEKNAQNVRDDYSKYDDKYSRRYRERSPKKTSRHRDIVSSTYYKNESKNRHDHRDSNKRSYSGSSRSIDSEPLVKTKKYADANNTDKFEAPKTRKNNLSSLLKNFDKKVESKRINSENSIEIGPVLPPHLKQNEIETESLSSNPTDTTVGPALPPQLNNSNDISNNGSSKFNNSFKSKAVSSLIFDNKVNNVSDTVATVIEKENEIHSAQPFVVNNSDDSCSIDNLTKDDHVESSEKDLFGPTIPPESKPETYGPTLPPKQDSDSYGPALPPSHVRDAIQGPALPPEMASELGETAQEDSEDDDDMVGPQVEGKMTKAQYLLDMRAIHIKRKLDEEKGGISKEVKKREEWMLELPPEKASNLGLGPRSFRMKEAPDMSNRSSWTDTPADKLRKEQQALVRI